LEQKKGDLELIRAKNMKILSKNTDTARASKVLKLKSQVKELARRVLPVAQPCHYHKPPFAAFASSTSCPFSLFLT